MAAPDFAIRLGLVGTAQVIQGVESVINILNQAVDKVKEWAEVIYELGMRGGEVSAVANAFERLVSPGFLSRLQQSTGGLVSNFNLMREAI